MERETPYIRRPWWGAQKSVFADTDANRCLCVIWMFPFDDGTFFFKQNFCFTSVTLLSDSIYALGVLSNLPRTFIPLLNWSDLLTVNCGGALVLLVGTGTLVVTVWIWTASKENKNQLEELTCESHFCGGRRPSVKLLPAGNRPALSSLGKDFGWDQIKHPHWTHRRSSFPVQDWP